MIELLRLEGNKAFVSWAPGAHSVLAVVEVGDGISTCPMSAQDQAAFGHAKPSRTFDSIQALAAHVRGE